MNAQSTSYNSANAGLDFGSSSLWSAEIMEAGIANGSITQDRLDDMAVRNMLHWYHLGLDDGLLPETASYTEYRDVRANHSDLIRSVAADSLVLLKNDNSSGVGLPLSKPMTLALFGGHAGPAMGGPNKPFTTQGTSSDVYVGPLATGAGSEQGSMTYVHTPYELLSQRVVSYGGMIWWIMNDTYSSSSVNTGSSSSSSSYSGGGFSAGETGTMTGNATDSSSGGPSGGMGGGMGGGTTSSSSGTSRGTAGDLDYSTYAENAAACLVFLNAYSGEGADRGELANADQDTLVNTVAAECNNTIVIINTVGPRLVDQWIENDNVTAVLYGGLLGQESGQSIADVLFGDVNPSGKLTYTIAKNETDYPAELCDTEDCDFSEAGLIDYRWFDAKVSPPRCKDGWIDGWMNGRVLTRPTERDAALRVWLWTVIHDFRL